MGPDPWLGQAGNPPHKILERVPRLGECALGVLAQPGP